MSEYTILTGAESGAAGGGHPGAAMLLHLQAGGPALSLHPRHYPTSTALRHHLFLKLHLPRAVNSIIKQCLKPSHPAVWGVLITTIKGSFSRVFQGQLQHTLAARQRSYKQFGVPAFIAAFLGRPRRMQISFLTSLVFYIGSFERIGGQACIPFDHQRGVLPAHSCCLLTGLLLVTAPG